MDNTIEVTSSLQDSQHFSNSYAAATNQGFMGGVGGAYDPQGRLHFQYKTSPPNYPTRQSPPHQGNFSPNLSCKQEPGDAISQNQHLQQPTTDKEKQQAIAAMISATRPTQGSSSLKNASNTKFVSNNQNNHQVN